MDDSTNVLSSVWENGKIIKPNMLYNLKKSTSFGELFEKTVGKRSNTSECWSWMFGIWWKVHQSCNCKFIKRPVSMCWIWVKICKIWCFKTWNSFCSTSKKNAFMLLMSSAKTMKLPDKISSDDKLMAPQMGCQLYSKWGKKSRC